MVDFSLCAPYDSYTRALGPIRVLGPVGCIFFLISKVKKCSSGDNFVSVKIVMSILFESIQCIMSLNFSWLLIPCTLMVVIFQELIIR